MSPDLGRSSSARCDPQPSKLVMPVRSRSPALRFACSGPEALRALAQLESTGLSRSDAIRKAILDSASRLRRRAAVAAEVAALEADEDDRREMLEVADFMESMRAAG
jgi:DNA polymerase III delta prime subunit